MKNYIYPASIFILSLAACNQSQNAVSLGSLGKTSFEDPKAEKTSGYSNVLLAEYAEYVLTLDTTDIKTPGLAAEKYKKLFTGKEPSVADSAFFIFNQLYEKLYRNLNELHDKDTTNYDPLVASYQPDVRPEISRNLIIYNRLLHENGFQIAMTEGMTYIQEDRDFIASCFYPFVSKTMKEYLVELNKENQEGFAEDAGMIISPRQLASRILWWENFIRNNASFIYIEEARENKKYFLTFLVEGMDNTPLLSDDHKTVEDYYETAYDYIRKSYPLSETNKLVGVYFEALLKNNSEEANRLLSKYRKEGIILTFGR
jgi:hypothetical protein